MQTIRRQHPFTPWSSRAFRLYFQNRKILTYDIETSGLSPAASQIILTGFLRVRPGEGGLYTAETVQYFAEKPGEEEAVVAASLAELREAEVVLTYNGRSFDLPFTENRARKLGLADGQKTGGLLPGLFDLDLFTIIRNWSDLGSFLPSLSQKSIEAYLGRSESREDEITGYDSVKLYENYLLIGSFNLREKILLHNHDDILQLAGLLPVLKNCDLHRALFHQGFPAGPFLVRKISPSMNGLSVTAEARGPVQEYISFPSQDRPFRLVSSASRGEVELTFPDRKSVV